MEKKLALNGWPYLIRTTPGRTGFYVDMTVLLTYITGTFYGKETKIDPRAASLCKQMGGRLEKDLGVNFIAQGETGNVCFAENNIELQDAFK